MTTDPREEELLNDIADRMVLFLLDEYPVSFPGKVDRDLILAMLKDADEFVTGLVAADREEHAAAIESDDQHGASRFESDAFDTGGN